MRKIALFLVPLFILALLVVPSALAGGTITVVPPGQALPNIDINSIPQFLVTLLFLVGIVVAIVFLIYGGIKWILSGGDSKQVEGARNHIVAAIVGLIVVVGAFVILNIVFRIVTGSDKDIFSGLCIPSLRNPDCKGASTPASGTVQCPQGTRLCPDATNCRANLVNCP